MDEIASIYGWRKVNAREALGIPPGKDGDEIWRQIETALTNVQITPAELLEALNTMIGADGRTASETIQDALNAERRKKKPAPKTREEAASEPDEEWQDRAAQSILNTMESSQTEWIKPDKPKDAVREYVKNELKSATWPSIDSEENTTQNVQAYLDKVTGELAGLGVSDNLAQRLSWEIHKERLNRWSLKNLNKLQANSPDKVVQGFLESLVSIKSPAQQNQVRAILNQSRRRKLSFQDTIQADAWKGGLSDRLVAAGVSEDLANRVSDELYLSKIPEYAASQAAKFQRAGEDAPGIISAITKAIADQPYRSQNPEWRRATAVRYFQDAGLDAERAADAAKVFDNVFVARESEARSRAARRLLEPKPRKKLKPGHEAAMDKLKQEIRLGLLDPSRTWEDRIAALKKWRPFTQLEHDQISEWMEKLDDALPHEQAKFYTQINNLLSTKASPEAMRELASFYSSNQLAGTGTQLLSYINPAFSAILRGVQDFSVSMATLDLNRPIFSAGALIRAMETWHKEFAFGWKNDAYTSQSLKTIEKLHNLHALMIRGLDDYGNPSLSPWKRAWGLIRYWSSHVDIVRRSLQSADQAWQSVYREWLTQTGGRDLMRRAGFRQDEISNLFNDAYLAAEQYYMEAKARGLGDLDARMEAKDRVSGDVLQMLKDNLGETAAKTVEQYARLESELEVGNHRGEGGWTNKLLTGIQNAMQENGFTSLMYRMVFGFPRVNFNILSRAAWRTPWGWKRLWFDKKDRALGTRDSDRMYKQSMMNELQRRDRMWDTITGTIFTIGLGALYFGLLRGKKDEDRELWFDFEGPSDKQDRNVWLAAGHRPSSVGIKIPYSDKRVALNWNRGGLEAIQFPIAMVSALEDQKLNTKDPEDLKVSEAAYKLASLTGFSATGRRDAPTVKSFSYMAASKATGFIPFAGTLRTINKLVDTRDTTTMGGAFIAATPVAPAVLGKPALNVLGEPVMQDLTGLKLQKLGLPITISSPLPLYRVMANQGLDDVEVIRPIWPLRSAIEKRIKRPITDEEFYDYTKEYGNAVRDAMKAEFDSLKTLPPEGFKARLKAFSDSAKTKADGTLERKPRTQEQIEAGAKLMKK
jgi:hypothetical protein